MGTTANGLILLKMVDPQSQTAAPSAIAYKLVLHEPVMGFWVAMVIFALKTAGKTDNLEVLLCAGASLLMLVLWFSLYFLYFKKKYDSQVKDRTHFLEEHLGAGAEGGADDEVVRGTAISVDVGEASGSSVSGRTSGVGQVAAKLVDDLDGGDGEAIPKPFVLTQRNSRLSHHDTSEDETGNGVPLLDQ